MVWHQPTRQSLCKKLKENLMSVREMAMTRAKIKALEITNPRDTMDLFDKFPSICAIF